MYHNQHCYFTTICSCTCTITALLVKQFMLVNFFSALITQVFDTIEHFPGVDWWHISHTKKMELGFYEVWPSFSTLVTNLEGLALGHLNMHLHQKLVNTNQNGTNLCLPNR